MNGKKIFAILLMAGGALASWSCTRADDICSLVCDCTHCNDEDEDRTCEYLNRQQDMAAVYGCEAAWESWAECVENKGTCIEESATFTTSEVNRCGSFVDLQIPCSGDAECSAQGAFCNNGSCMRRACNADPQNQTCTTDSDCPQGEDLCLDMLNSLADCERTASGVNYFFVGLPSGGDSMQ